MAETWLKCSACRADIAYGATHWVCSVSTCNRSRTRLVFCTVACWDSHLATLRHREAWAVEAKAPSKESWAQELATETTAATRPAATPAAKPIAIPPRDATPAPTRRVVGEVPGVRITTGDPELAEVADKDVLIVVSKMKKYIKDRSGMNCSDAVAELLSDHVRAICDDAIRAAGRDERKTVLDRDVPRARR
ncbi:MAG: hypothetical protein AB7P03_26780 [Kofleriaceae bacterium]